MTQEKVVYIVHCIDTEGPLYESTEAKFERLRNIFAVDLEPTRDNLEKLKRKEIDLDGKEDVVARTFSDHLGNYKETWDQVDEMLLRVMSEGFRSRVTDSDGGGWIFNWFCLDHVDYVNNPRRRDIGYHNVFDHYREMVSETGSFQDGIHWHFHPMSMYRDAHRCATSYTNSPHLYETLCRRILDRDWFPSVFRAGFTAERPDSNWFLEQWIPFDISNRSVNDPGMAQQSDFVNGRFGDWRLAPDDWSVYHPSHDNYQLPGDCRRWIARALNVLNRIASLTQTEVNKAFARANEGLPTIMGVACHDYRELSTEVEEIRRMVANSAKTYPDVKFRFAEAKDAFQKAIYGDVADIRPVELDCRLISDANKMFLDVNVKSGEVFGPQPFLAFKLKSGRYVQENFDFDLTPTRWTYTFDQESLLPGDLESIGIAAADKFGNTFVTKLDVPQTTEIAG